jgi:hypothetical protein
VGKKILILPPPKHGLTVSIVGVFPHMRLENDEDFNYWTLQQPIMLTLATQLQLEMLYRNTAGVSDSSVALGNLIRNLNVEVIEQSQEFSDFRLSTWRYQDEF